MLYAFDAQDVQRIRSLLIAYEQGRIRLNSPLAQEKSCVRQDVILGYVPNDIAAGSTGTGYYVSADGSSPPVLTQESDLANVYTVLNPSGQNLAAGYYLLAREPSYGYYIPAIAAVASQTTSNGQYVLTSGGFAPNQTGTATLCSLTLGGLNSDLWFVTFGMSVYCNVSILPQYAGQGLSAEAWLTMLLSESAPNLSVWPFTFTDILVASQEVINTSPYVTPFIAGNQMWPAGITPPGAPSTTQTMSGIVTGDQILSLSATMNFNGSTSSSSYSFQGTIPTAWIFAFQISPLASVGGGGGGGGSSGTDDDSAYQTINGTINCGSWV